ncbi:MAG: diguanylate cyclase [Pseudomonadota bacterium]|nr:diguanylate cyclase [Pseudomonadota bacterium]
MKVTRRCGLLWLWILVMSVQAMAVSAEPEFFIPTISVYEQTDNGVLPSASAGVADLLQRFRFHDEISGANKGYAFSPHWVLIPLEEIATRIPAAEPLWLEYGYPPVDSITVYATSGDGWAQIASTGDQSPWKTRQRHGPKYYFKLPPATTHVLVRLQTIGSLQYPFALYSEAGLDRSLLNEGVVDGMFFGALTIMIFYNLFVYLMARDPAYLYYVILLSAITLFKLAITGYGSMYFWKDDPAWVNSHIQPVSVGICLMFVVLFTRRMLNIKALSTRLDAALQFSCGVSALMVVLGMAFSSGWVVKFTSTWPSVVVLLVIAAGVLALVRNQSGSRIFVAAWGAGLIGAVLYSAQQQGWLPANELTVNSLKLGIVLNVVLLSFALASQIRRLRHEKETYKQEARQNYELALVDALTGVPNRRAFDERLEQEIERARRDNRSIALMMIDVDYFKNFNDAYGHQQGDDTLVRAALIMRNCLRRPSDSLFRYGGEEFSVVLPDTGEAGARHTGDRVMNAIRKLAIPHSESPFKQVTVSIGVAVAKTANIEAEDFIQIADQALYQAKRKGRNSLVLTEQRENPVVNIGDYFKNTPKDTL